MQDTLPLPPYTGSLGHNTSFFLEFKGKHAPVPNYVPKDLENRFRVYNVSLPQGITTQKSQDHNTKKNFYPITITADRIAKI
jgi:hypothetical protein